MKKSSNAEINSKNYYNLTQKTAKSMTSSVQMIKPKSDQGNLFKRISTNNTVPNKGVVGTIQSYKNILNAKHSLPSSSSSSNKQIS